MQRTARPICNPPFCNILTSKAAPAVSVTTDYSVADGEWHLYTAFYYQDSNTLRLLVDNVEAGECPRLANSSLFFQREETVSVEPPDVYPRSGMFLDNSDQFDWTINDSFSISLWIYPVNQPYSQNQVIVGRGAPYVLLFMQMTTE